jgi:hypothetical protein
MGLTLQIESAGFERDVRRLSELTGKSLQVVLDEQGRLFTRDVVKATAPFYPGRNWTESLASQHEIGRNATERQIRSLFRPLASLRISTSDTRGGRRLRSLASTGKFEEATELLKAIGFRTQGLVPLATRELHEANRNSRGRVTKKTSYLVRDGRSIESLVRRKKSYVGRAKGGWVKAANALGLHLPGWITKWNSEGIFLRGGTAASPWITIGNAVPYIQQSGEEDRIIDWALANRRRNLPKQIEQTMNALIRRANARH